MTYEYLILKFDTTPINMNPHCRWRTSDGRDMGGEGKLAEIMNQLGQEGWEAYSCLGIQNVSCVAFKRVQTSVRPHPPADLEPLGFEEPAKTDLPRRGRPPKVRP